MKPVILVDLIDTLVNANYGIFKDEWSYLASKEPQIMKKLNNSSPEIIEAGVSRALDIFDKGVKNEEINFQLIPGTIEGLEKISQKYSLGCLSSNKKETILYCFNQFNIHQYFVPELIFSTVEFNRFAQKDSISTWKN